MVRYLSRRLASLSVCISVILCGAFAETGELRDVIDAKVQAAWKAHDVTPAGPASDAEFLRRVCLDLLGTIPSYEEAKAFLSGDAPDKREKLIERLLADPRFARHQAEVWDMVLFGRNPPGFGTDKREGFQDWLRKQFADNVPYDKWAGRILRAEGDTLQQGAPMFFVQYSRRPEDATEAVTQRFLGVQLQCARCHDHPFESWTQLDFYGMAAFFARLQVVTLKSKGNQRVFAIGEKSAGDVLFTGPATNQTPGKKGQPVKPKFLHGQPLAEPELPKNFSEPRNLPSGKMPPAPKFSRKNALADWIASPKNPYFARAVVNRVWAQFLGRGLVHPVDNMSESNEPSHPELLEALTAGLIEHKFNLKWYIRELVNSRAYQLSSAGPVEEALPEWFEQARWRPLAAEELLDAWKTAVNYDEAAKSSGKKSHDRYAPLGSGYLLQFFGRPSNGEGHFQGGLHEHLYMNNGGLASLLTTQKGGLHHALLASKAPWEERVERMFLSILSRPPRPPEREKFVQFLTADKAPADRLKEAMWTLMTCSEFRFNH